MSELSPYQRELSEFRLAYSKACSLVCIGLVLIAVGLDYALYPLQFYQLLSGRLLLCAVTLVIYAVLRSSYGLHWVRWLTLFWLSLPQVMIGWMIWKTDGADSIYFLGLHLALYATGIILPITFLETLTFGLFTYAIYFFACYAHPSGIADPRKFIGYSLFILLAVMLSSFCTYFNERGRMNLFDLKRKLADKNEALQKINEELAQIKGHMIQQEKMAALGTLSAGLLHEVNNPVNYSLMAVGLALRDPTVDKTAELQEILHDALQGMERVKNIVTDLKTFAYQRQDADTNHVFLLENALQSALRMSSFELKGIDVRLDLPQDTHVCGDEPAIIGVLINLLGNAVLALRKATPAAPRIEVAAVHQNRRLHLTVRDNGTGIKAEHLTRVFEPFFTTREIGQGLGLGLSVSYSIIQRHGSLLQVRSEVGAWTEFAFELPLANPATPE